jgi:transposase-like protein
MKMRKYIKRSSEFKTRVALEAIKGELSSIEIAKKYNVDPGSVSTWKHMYLKSRQDAFSAFGGKIETVTPFKKPEGVPNKTGQKHRPIESMFKAAEDFEKFKMSVAEVLAKHQVPESSLYLWRQMYKKAYAVHRGDITVASVVNDTNFARSRFHEWIYYIQNLEANTNGAQKPETNKKVKILTPPHGQGVVTPYNASADIARLNYKINIFIVLTIISSIITFVMK